MTTAIVKYEPGGELQHERNLLPILLSEAPDAKTLVAAINHAWPGDVDPQRRMHKTKQLMEQAAIAITNSKNPSNIRRCCQASIFDTLTSCASMNLSLQKALGEAYIVPFGNVATLMVGYKGFVRLICNTGYIAHIESKLVYEGERFRYWTDDNGPHIEHEPDLQLQGDYSKIVAAYAIGYPREAHLAKIIEVMNRAQLEKVKRVSKAKDGPHRQWPAEMARKAPIRRMEKFIPKSADDLASELLLKAVEHDNRMFDLSGYQGMAAEHAESRRAEDRKSLESFAEGRALPLPTGQHAEPIATTDAAAPSPETPLETPAESTVDPDDPATWEKAEDGEPIPPAAGAAASDEGELFPGDEDHGQHDMGH